MDVVDREVSPDLARAHLYTSSCFRAACSQPCSCNSSPPCSCDSDDYRGVCYPTAVCTHRYLTGKAQNQANNTFRQNVLSVSATLCFVRLVFGCCDPLHLLPYNETTFSRPTPAASGYESTGKHQPHHSCGSSIYKRGQSLTFSSIKGLKACERFLIGVVRPKHYHEAVVDGDVRLVARSLLSVCTVPSTQRSQGLPTRAQLQNGQTNPSGEHGALIFPTRCHGWKSTCLTV